MSLKDFINGSQEQDNPVCPECRSEGEHLRNTEYRCTTNRSQCEVISWFETNRS